MTGQILYSIVASVALKSAVVPGAAWLTALLLKRQSAALRHLVWSAAFAALLALPVLSIALPALRVPVNGSPLAPGILFRTNSLAMSDELGAQTRPAITASPLNSESWTRNWPMSLMLLWAAGSIVSFAQMIIGWAAIGRLRRRSIPFDLPELAPSAEQLGIEEKVSLLEAPQGSMPMTYGVFRSTIFMPANSLEWSTERRRLVVSHELAHVRRGDSATQLMARTALGLYWWNPIVWVAWRVFAKEREMAADDLVLSAGACASEYATHLFEIARSVQSPVALGSTAIAIARRSQLEGRLLAILDSSRDRRPAKRASLVAASLLAAGIIAPLAAVQAQSPTGQSEIAPGTDIIGMRLIGDAEREQGDFEKAKAQYTKALAKLSTGPEAATVLIHLGTAELATKNFEAAMSDFERAQSVDSNKAGEARMWMAITQQRQNNLEAADGLYQSALSAQDPNSAEAAIVMQLYAQLLKQQDRKEEANTIQSQATAILKAEAAQALSTNQPSSSDVYRVGHGVTAPILILKVEPSYTQEARLARYQGVTLLSVEIGVDGLAHNVKVVRGLGFGLDQKAVEAVGHWRFKPATKDGQPVTVSATIEVNFALV